MADCDINALMAEVPCILCMSNDQLDSAIAWLICQWANAPQQQQ